MIESGEIAPFRCPASISGTCLNMTQGWTICPPDECDLTPDEADESASYGTQP